MNTLFLVLAQYQGLAVIPIERVAADYFPHLTAGTLIRRVAEGKIDLTITRIEASQKAARGVHVADLAKYIDTQRELAKKEMDQLHGRYKRAA